MRGGTSSAALRSREPLDACLAAAFGEASPAADWILTPREVEAWLKSAKPGERLLYGQGARMVVGATSELLGTLQRGGDVLLFQPRSSDGRRFDFIAVKRVTERSKQMAGRTADPALRLIFRRLKTAAEAGERCPTDKELAALTGLRIPQVKWRLQKLINEGRIETRVELMSAPSPYFRIVAILDKDGKVAAETAGVHCRIGGRS